MRTMNLNNKNGSALIWAVVGTAVLAIIVGAVLTLAYSNYQRSINNNIKKQAYFTARSTVASIADEIKSGNENGTAILDKLVNAGDFVELNNISFSDTRINNSITTARVELVDSTTIKISATTTASEQVQTVTLDLLKNSGTDLPISDAFPGIVIDDDAIIVTDSFSIDNSTTQDIYAVSGASVIFLNNADFIRNIYCETGTEINISQGAKFNGSIYAQSGTAFSFNKLHNMFDGKIYVTNRTVLKVNNKNYTITINNDKISVSPSGMPSAFKALLTIYYNTSGDESWGDTVYE